MYAQELKSSQISKQKFKAAVLCRSLSALRMAVPSWPMGVAPTPELFSCRDKLLPIRLHLSTILAEGRASPRTLLLVHPLPLQVRQRPLLVRLPFLRVQDLERQAHSRSADGSPLNSLGRIAVGVTAAP